MSFRNHAERREALRALHDDHRAWALDNGLDEGEDVGDVEQEEALVSGPVADFVRKATD